MKTIFQATRAITLGLASLLSFGPLSAAEPTGKDSSQSAKPAAKKDDHDHKDHKGHGDHEDHDKAPVGTGKTDIREISSALQDNLACLEKEMPAADHAKFHMCLEAIGSLGVDLIALKTPADPVKKKRVNGYAKNLERMAHKVDELMDQKQPEKAKAQLQKLKSQVDMIESQFDELAKKPAGK